MKSSLAFDANRRVDEYRRSVLSVQENVLLFKGFLGPALRERRGMATVGMRAARAAGVIVDDAGKLRCPPGTPNANQFTDLQMSNCMVAGAEAIKRGMRAGRREIGQILASINEAMTNDRKSRLAQVAVTAGVAYLQALDYRNFESAAGPVALIGVDILRAGGRDTLEKAFDSLERRGKITPEQRKDLDKMLDALHQQGLVKYTAALAGLRRRRKTIKPNDDGPIDGDAQGLFGKKRINLVKRRKSGSLARVEFSPDDVELAQSRKREEFIQRYVPDLADKPPREFMDELRKRMGIIDNGRDFETQIKELVDELERAIPREQEELLNKKLAKSRRDREGRKKIAEYLSAWSESLQTPDGRKAIEDQVAKNYLDTLMGVEMVLAKHPQLRNKVAYELADASTAIASTAGAYASMRDTADGKLSLAIVSNPFAVAGIPTSASAGKSTGEEVGELLDEVVATGGADTYNTLLGIHEMAHIVHFYDMMRQIGIDAGPNEKPILEQLKEHGPRLMDSYVGGQLAASAGLSLETTWDAIVSDPEISKKVFGFEVDSPEKELAKSVALLAMNTGYPWQSGGTKFSEGTDKIPAKSVLPASQTGAQSKNMQAFRALLGAVQDDDTWELFQVFDSEYLSTQTMNDLKNIVSDMLDGQTIEEFIKEGSEALGSALGYPPHLAATKGMGKGSVQAVMGSSSEYGETDIMEAVAEAKTLATLLENYPTVAKNDITDRVVDMIGEFMPNKISRVVPKLTPEAQAWIIRLARISERMPQFPTGAIKI